MEGSLRMKRVMKNYNTIAFDGHSNSTAISPVKKGMEKRKLFGGEVGNIKNKGTAFSLKELFHVLTSNLFCQTRLK